MWKNSTFLFPDWKFKKKDKFPDFSSHFTPEKSVLSSKHTNYTYRYYLYEFLFQVSVNPTSYSTRPIFNNEENTVVEVTNNIESTPNIDEKINTKFENLVKETILDEPDLSQFNLFEDIPADSASEELLTQNGNLDLVSLEIFIHISRCTRYVMHFFQNDKDFWKILNLSKKTTYVPKLFIDMLISVKRTLT